MNVLIIYFSASGNTAHGVRLVQRGIAASGNSCDVTTVRDFRADKLKDYDLIGFAAPVFDFKPALPLLDLIAGLPQGEGKPCFSFFSLGGDAVNSLRILQKKLELKGYVLIDHHEMVAEDSWTTIRIPGRPPGAGQPTFEAQEAVVAFGAGLAQALNSFLLGLRAAPPLPRFRFHPYHLFSYFYNYKLLSRLFVTRVNQSRCNRCGQCIAQCPTGRMRFERFPNPKGKCCGCYGCINTCPQDAIEGWLTRGKSRYRGLSEAQKI